MIYIIYIFLEDQHYDDDAMRLTFGWVEAKV